MVASAVGPAMIPVRFLHSPKPPHTAHPHTHYDYTLHLAFLQPPPRRTRHTMMFGPTHDAQKSWVPRRAPHPPTPPHPPAPHTVPRLRARVVHGRPGNTCIRQRGRLRVDSLGWYPPCDAQICQTLHLCHRHARRPHDECAARAVRVGDLGRHAGQYGACRRRREHRRRRGRGRGGRGLWGGRRPRGRQGRRRLRAGDVEGRFVSPSGHCKIILYHLAPSPPSTMHAYS